MDFKKNYDVIVVGAGISGIAAAVEAARSGKRTALIEKTVLTGGLATAGLVNVYLPLCDGEGKQVTFGIAEELLHLSTKYGPGDVPSDWRDASEGKAISRYQVTFSPAAYVLALDELLIDSGIEVWLDTLVCQPVMLGNRVSGVEVENKSGRGLLSGFCCIDASGDAIVAHRAGAEYVEGENFLTIWALEAKLEAAKRAAKEEKGDPLLARAILGGDNTGSERPAGSRIYAGLSGKDASEFAMESRKLLRERHRELHAKDPERGRHNLWAVTLPSVPQFRMTRRIVGQTTMKSDEHGLLREDAVGLVADWRKPGFVWEVPYGSLLPRKISGLLAVGRCIASDGDAWEIMRVIPAAALTGQVAGIAATLAVEQNISPEEVDVGNIQERLRIKDIPYHLSDLGL